MSCMLGLPRDRREAVMRKGCDNAFAAALCKHGACMLSTTSLGKEAGEQVYLFVRTIVLACTSVLFLFMVLTSVNLGMS